LIAIEDAFLGHGAAAQRVESLLDPLDRRGVGAAGLEHLAGKCGRGGIAEGGEDG